jgi:Ser/Thr protein kinase RdoA (MazF antagonist)
MTVEGLVSAHLGAPGGAHVISREPSPFARRSPAEVVTVQVDDGTTLRVFLKRVRREVAGHPDKLRRDREPLVYRLLLAGRELPVPTFYGAGWDPASGRHDVLLEHIDGWSLKYRSVEHWVTAARSLALLHAHFAARAETLERADFLLRLDGDYLAAWAERAFAAVRSMSPALERRLRQAVGGLRDLADQIGREPLTLVHNDLAPKNVVADTSTTPARICFVDWEMAGAGCGLHDLAHLTHGFDARERRLLTSAYWEEMARMQPIESESERCRVLAACELHNALYRLAHIHDWRLGREPVERWIDEVSHQRRTASG